MKMSPQYVKAQANMQPGVITSDGFLGDDPRPIVDIIAADEIRMRKLGLEFDEIVEKMRYLFDEGRGLLSHKWDDDTGEFGRRDFWLIGNAPWRRRRLRAPVPARCRRC